MKADGDLGDATGAENENRPVRGWQVGQWLLANNFLLTALELLVEAQESGKEADVEGLKHFFSDKGKFPPEELARYDPKDALDLQRQAKEREERLALVEYELRIAKEDLAQLQRDEGSGEGAEKRGSATPAKAPAEQIDSREPCSNDLPYKDRMQLNGAVKQYLALYGYKLTHLTFIEEAADATPADEPSHEQSLLGIFNSSKQKEAALSTAREAVAAKVELQNLADKAQGELRGVQDQLAAAQQENRLFRADIDSRQSKLDWLSQKLQEAEHNENEARRAARESGIQAPVVAVPDQPRGSGGMPPGASLETPKADAVLLEVAAALPKFVNHMLINARVEMLPLFMTLIQELKDRSARDLLAHAMFNIVKKPTAGQRQMICDGMAELASRIGPQRTAEELLPQCWEQMAHKHAERRMVVAECCGKLAGLTEPDMRQSLLLSTLQQLSSDKDAGVQRAVAGSVAALLPHLANHSKYRTVEGMLLGLVVDGHGLVLEMVNAKLLPAILEWTGESDLLHTSLVPSILGHILKILRQCPLLGGVDEEAVRRGEPGLRVIGDQQQQQVQVLLRVFVALLKPLQAKALASRPAWAAADGSEGNLEARKGAPAAAEDADSNLESKEADRAEKSAVRASASGQLSADGITPAESEVTADSLHEESTSISVVESFDDPLGALNQGSVSRASIDGSEADAINRAPSTDSRGHLQAAPELEKEQQEEVVRPASQADSLAFSQWLKSDAPDEWVILTWFLEHAVPQLQQLMRMVPPREQTEGLRRRIRAALKAICKTFGEQFTAGALAPLFMAATGLSSFQTNSLASARIEGLAQTYLPQDSEAARIGRLCVLPQLLAGVLPGCGAGALAGLLRLLMVDANDADAWALIHPEETEAALRFASGFEDLQGQLLALLWEVTAKPSSAARLCASKLAASISPSLSQSLLRRQVLPALVKLVDDSALEVKLGGIEGLAALWQLAASNAGFLEELHRHLDGVMSAEVHEVDLAVVTSLSGKARSVTDLQLEYLLQKVLLLLVSMQQRAAAGRSPLQLKAAATALLDALASIASCEIGEQTVSLHLLAALQSLGRESELLEPLQRERLEQLTRQQTAMTPAMRTPERASRPSPQQPPQARRPEMSSISSDMTNLEASRAPLPPGSQLRSSSPNQSRRSLGEDPTGRSQKQGKEKRGGAPYWRDSGKAILRSVQGRSSSKN